MSNSRTWWSRATLVPAVATLALLGGCVVAPAEPWEIGTPVVTSGTIYYGNVYRSYPDYYYPAPSWYYPVPSRSHVRPGRTYRSARPGDRPGAARTGHTGTRPDRGQAHQRPASRPPAGAGNRVRADGPRPGVRTRSDTHQRARDPAGRAAGRSGLGRGGASGVTRSHNGRAGARGGR